MQRLFYIATKTYPLWLGIVIYILSGYILFSNAPLSTSNGPILFWYKEAIYTINPDGTNLHQITPALLANQRFTEVSPGCYGLANASCWILIGHVLYHISGQGIPLPLNAETEWLTAPASWSPDGMHLAYTIRHKQTWQRILVIYNPTQAWVWHVTTDVDETIKPVWSPGCANSINTNCYLAYSLKPQTQQTNNKIAILNLKNNQVTVWPVNLKQGHLLRWSPTNQLYIGGYLGWFDIKTGLPINSNQPHLNPILGPKATYIIYYPSPNSNQQGLWVTEVNNKTNHLTYLSSIEFDKFNQNTINKQLLWHPSGNTLALFNQNTLTYHNLQQNNTTIWYHSNIIDNIQSYAFSPSNDGLALVTEQQNTHSEKKQNQLIIIYNSGEFITLQSKTQDPILLLSWLPNDYTQYIPLPPPDIMTWLTF